MQHPAGLRRVKALIGDDRCHVEQRRGTHDEAREYCLKRETRDPNYDPFELGEPPINQGKRQDLTACKDLILAGVSEADLATEYFGTWCQHRQAFREFRELIARRDRLQQPAFQKKTVVWIYGPTKTGKTSKAHSDLERLYGREGYYVLSPSNYKNTWFDGLQPSDKGILIEELAPGVISMNLFLRLTDGRDIQVESKRGRIASMVDTIYITSNFHPDEIYPPHKYPRQHPAMMRRISSLLFMDDWSRDSCPMPQRQ